MSLRQGKGGRKLATETEILQDQIITGPLFNEPMRVVIVRPNGPDSVEAGLEGMETSNFRRVTLTSSDIASLAGCGKRGSL